MRPLSRRELTLLGLALLLPLPLVALVGHSTGFPILGDGLGSLVSLEEDDERTGSTRTGGAAVRGSNERRSSSGTSRISRARGGVEPPGRTTTRVSSDGSPSGAAGDAETADRPPRDESAGGRPPTGDTPGSGEPGSSPKDGGFPAGESETGSEEGAPGIAVTTAGAGSELTIGVTADGVTADTEADSAGSGDAGLIGIEVTDSDGSSTGTRIRAPGAETGIP